LPYTPLFRSLPGSELGFELFVLQLELLEQLLVIALLLRFRLSRLSLDRFPDLLFEVLRDLLALAIESASDEVVELRLRRDRLKPDGPPRTIPLFTAGVRVGVLIPLGRATVA